MRRIPVIRGRFNHSYKADIGSSSEGGIANCSRLCVGISPSFAEAINQRVEKVYVCTAPSHELGAGNGSEDRASLCLTPLPRNRRRR